MRIISKFKDYYDSGIAYGVDPHIVYVRNTDEVSVESNSVRIWPRRFAVIGFCGQLFPCRDWREEDSSLPKECILFGDNIHTKQITVSLKTYIGAGGVTRTDKSWKMTRAGGWHVITNRQEYEEFQAGHFDDLKRFFEKFNTPIFFLKKQRWSDDNKVIINPCLKDLNFAGQFNAMDAFQKISQFVVNLNVKNQMPEMQPSTEKINVMRHGMDKHSFRRNSHPSKPRGNK